MTLDEARSITCAIAWGILKMPDDFNEDRRLFVQYMQAIQTYAAHHKMSPLDTSSNQCKTWELWAKYIVEQTIPKEHVPIDN